MHDDVLNTITAAPNIEIVRITYFLFDRRFLYHLNHFLLVGVVLRQIVFVDNRHNRINVCLTGSISRFLQRHNVSARIGLFSGSPVIINLDKLQIPFHACFHT